jgi:cell division protein FtsL
MLNKPFFLIIFFLIITQVVFSFYYSSEIINQNSLINQNQITLQSSKIKNQKLEADLASLSSLTRIEATASQKNYIDLKENLNIKN